MEHADLIEEVKSNVKQAAKAVKDAVRDAAAKADDKVLKPAKSKWKDSMNIRI